MQTIEAKGGAGVEAVGVQAGIPVRFEAADGYCLAGFLWQTGETRPDRSVVLIACATSVRCRYYSRFASYLFDHGFDVLTFDYRGIDQSRPQRMRGLDADWVDWGEKDVEAALAFLALRFPGRPVDVVAHSIGGLAIGLAPSSHRLRRIVTVGAQYAYWRDYAPAKRRRMLWKWHVVMPLLTALFGYFPAKRLGWMEDTPQGVVRNWSRMGAHFEDTVCRSGKGGTGRDPQVLRQRLRQVTASILAISLTDDPHGTVPAVRRLLAYFDAAKRRHLHLAPSDIGHTEIGHFAFFHDRFRATLWPLALSFLRDGAVPDAFLHALIDHDSL
ncbi:putative alpha/beta hydrolase [Neorhizobium galegae]|uniref:alpha/beta hydrolase family protein n=1 Tax=Neorhizobium galegae TaxID=399 RepID=UPI001AE1D2DF|nr:alpha/beta fold hydrolase [Neorhizobium galegae]MBP2550507.1 putative alpha/beta hydrolase [Neorhizobium galegae]